MSPRHVNTRCRITRAGRIIAYVILTAISHGVCRVAGSDAIIWRALQPISRYPSPLTTVMSPWRNNFENTSLAFAASGVPFCASRVAGMHFVLRVGGARETIGRETAYVRAYVTTGGRYRPSCTATTNADNDRSVSDGFSLFCMTSLFHFGR